MAKIPFAKTKIGWLFFWFGSALVFFSSSVLTGQEEIVSETRQRQQALDFGTDKEVLEVVKKLIEEKSSDFNEQLKDLFEQFSDPQLKIAIFKLYEETEYSDGRQIVGEILNASALNSDALIIAALRFLGSGKEMGDHFEAVAELSRRTEAEVARTAILVLGQAGGEQALPLLLERLADSAIVPALKEAVIDALGELEDKRATPELLKIVKDEQAARSDRWLACRALGKIGDESALPVLMSLLSDPDPNLRAFVVEAVGSFPGPEVAVMLRKALRDSFWKVRRAAIVKIGQAELTEFEPALLYKAQNDPEMLIKQESIKALGQLGTGGGLTGIREIAVDQSAPLTLRETAIQVLTATDLRGSLPDLVDLIDAEWEKKQSRLLVVICRELAQASGAFLEPIYARFITHGDVTVCLFGLQGIKNNNLIGQKSAVENLTKEGYPPPVRRLALSLIESW